MECIVSLLGDDACDEYLENLPKTYSYIIAPRLKKVIVRKYVSSFLACAPRS